MKITFVRFGDFWESFDEQARIVSTVCGLTLTKRRTDGAPACGVPVWNAEPVFAELREAGHEVETA